MKNKIFFILSLLLFVVISAYSQEDEGDSVQYKRMRWFSDHRKDQNGVMQLDAYYNALQEKKTLSSGQGMFSGTSSNWISLGPQPGTHNNYTAGRCQTVLINGIKDPTGNTAYLAEANGGLWKTINLWEANPDNVVWTPITWNSPYIDVLSSGSFTIDPNDPTGNTIYYGTGEDIEYTTLYLGTGIYKTTDEGLTWIKGTGLPAATKVFKIAVRPNHPLEVLAALGSQKYSNGLTECGVYRSTDGGISWFILPETQNLECTDIAFRPDNGYDNIAFCVGPENPGFVSGTDFCISTNGGASFQRRADIIQKLHGRSLISICKSSPNIIYVLTVSNNFSPPPPQTDTTGLLTLYLSTDFGNSFIFKSRIEDPYPDFSSFIRVCPMQSHVVYAGGYDLFESQNFGGGFTKKNPNSVHVDFHNMDYFPTSDPLSNDVGKMVFTCDGGIWRTTDFGTTFENLNKTLCGLEFYKIGTDPFIPDKMLGASIDNGLQFRNLGTNQWTLKADGDYANIAFSKSFSNNFICVPCPNVPVGLFYSTDGGNTGLQQSDYSFQQGETWVPPLLSDPTVPGKFYTAKHNLVVSTNSGQHWEDIGSMIDVNNGRIQQLEINSSNSQILYATTYGLNVNNLNVYQRLYRTINGGQNWLPLHEFDDEVKYISCLRENPAAPNEVFVTLAGYRITGDNSHAGLIYKSTDNGDSWTNITGNLPNNPVNDLLVHYEDCSGNAKYFAATDIGVFGSSDNGTHWYEVGPTNLDGKLPNSTCFNLQLSRITNKLRVGTFGIGAWEIQLPGDIYVRDRMYIENNSNTNDVNINSNIYICSGGTLIFPYNCNVRMAANTRIYVMEGGRIDASSGNGVTFTAQSGSWGGIAFLYGSSGNLNNCAFQNSDVPIQISYATPSDIGGGTMNPTVNITINGCSFQNGSVDINSTSTIATFIEYCTFNGSNPTTKTAIELNNSSSVLIQYNAISNSQNGISESAGNSEIYYNTISNGSVAGVWGINVDNSQTPRIRNNTITGFSCGIHLLNASPKLLSNIINTSTTNGDSAVYVGYGSNPRLRPVSDGGTISWDAGQNTIGSSTTGSANSIVVDNGYPDINTGYNHLNAGNKYITGTLSSGIIKYFITYNCWNGSTGDPTSKISLGSPRIYWSPATCDPPPGAYIYNENKLNEVAGIASDPNDITNSAAPVLDPLPPYIIDKGFGHYDTIKVTSGNLDLPQNEILYSQAVKEEYLGNYSNAKNIYQQIIQDYHDSITAVKSLLSLLPCIDKLTADTSRYTALGNYYQSVLQNYGNDTLLLKTANELSHKTLIRRGYFPLAITNYESDIQNTNDSLEILCYQLNIVETYMLMQDHGDNSVQFTGRNIDLKPKNISDGFKKIYELLHRIKLQDKTGLIPKVFNLSQNYPNPFNPTTTIKYALPIATKVNIKIYDILGREVKTLVNEFKDAGFYEIKFDGTNYASGVYFYRIEAGKFVQSKKMVIIK